MTSRSLHVDSARDPLVRASDIVANVIRFHAIDGSLSNYTSRLTLTELRAAPEKPAA